MFKQIYAFAYQGIQGKFFNRKRGPNLAKSILKKKRKIIKITEIHLKLTNKDEMNFEVEVVGTN